MIHLWDNLYVKADVVGYQLIRKGTGKNGPINYIQGYFYTVSAVCRAVIEEIERRTVIDQSTIEFRDLVDKLTVLEKEWAESLSNEVTEEAEECEYSG